jgi:putative Mg2+ transporter-C (MgtC) family protein
MSIVPHDVLASYWSAPEVSANVLIFFNLLGALALGLLIGYERSYRGRAAGMRTYGLVCMASTALTVFVGFPALWFGGSGVLTGNPDPTRVVQGIVTGIGFLGAGVIMKEGMNIRGLSTAASIWTAAVVGVLVGVGFYVAAVCLTMLTTFCMVVVARLERWLPTRSGVAMTIEFEKGFVPPEESLHKLAMEHGYEIDRSSFSIRSHEGRITWHLIALAIDSRKGTSFSELARMMNRYERVQSFELNHCRN